MRKLFVVFLISLVSLLLVAAPALAIDWRESDIVQVGKDEVINDDMWLAGLSVIVDGTINGDLFVFGDSIEINGTVNGNLITGGNRADIKGTVTGSVYSVTGSINVSGRIERTLAATAATVTLEPGAYVGRSGLLAAARVEVGGQIGKELKAYACGMRIAAGAVIEGPVDYTGDTPATIEQGARTGDMAFHQISLSRATRMSIWWKVIWFLGCLLAGLAALTLFPSLRRTYPEAVMQKPWKAPLTGFLALITIPVGALLLLVTVIGIPLSLLIMAAFPLLIYLGQVLVSWTAGKLLADRVEGFRNLRWQLIFAMGALVTTVATALPVAGCIFSFAVVLYGLGGLYYLMIKRTA
ncbi:MAG TPA: polymer-forming cytoskeletal protein [Symbiobacteriaceae bacterium]|nr:polymer-forming cytoskeletal protein [Symbiobacteriaceae bacterium]